MVNFMAPAKVALDWQSLLKQQSYLPMGFCNELVLSFFQQLSRRIMQSQYCRQYNELIALAHWLREGNLRSMVKPNGDTMHKPLGLAVHFTPANVDTMFIYSWALSLLVGNNNIVRISTRGGDVQSLLLEQLNHLFSIEQFLPIAQRNQFIQYAHDSVEGSELTSVLCSIADVRIMWGGDASVNAIRQFPCKPRCRDISFADRMSVCLINADAVSQAEEAEKAIKALIKDVTPYQQQACSSPKLLFWLGDSHSLYQFVDNISSVDESEPDAHLLSRKNEQLVVSQSIQLVSNVKKVLSTASLCFIECETIAQDSLTWHVGHNVLLCQCITDLEAMASILDQKIQTLAYFGVSRDELIKFIDKPSISGIDRVIPLGESLVFSAQWDSYDLIGQLARQVVIE